MGIRIVTDSTADLNEELVRKYNIKIVPLTVHFKDKQYKDIIEISSKQFFKMLKECDELPKTSQVNPAEFEDIFDELLVSGDEIVGIFVSTDLSGTYNSAKLAKEILQNDKIHIIDSRTTTIGLGALVVKAAQLKEEGKTAVQIVKEIERIKINSIVLAMPETLEYLKKGGRLSPAKAMIASVLNLKPILTVKDGIVEPLDKVRGMQKGIGYFIDYLREHVTEKSEVFLLNAQNDEMVEKLAERLKEEYKIKNIHICGLGPTVGVHLGPGSIGISVISGENGMIEL